MAPNGLVKQPLTELKTREAFRTCQIKKKRKGVEKTRVADEQLRQCNRVFSQSRQKAEKEEMEETLRAAYLPQTCSSLTQLPWQLSKDAVYAATNA